MVNWCPQCRTAISDVEVEFEERNSKLYHVDYPVEGTDRRLTVGVRDLDDDVALVEQALQE